MVDDMERLSSKSCVPCRGGVAPLTPEAARGLLAAVPAWRLEENATRLVHRFEFRDFVEAIKFVNRVADVAEKEGHHPDIHIHYNLVKLVLWTHDLGGLSENDFILAAKIDEFNE